MTRRILALGTCSLALAALACQPAETAGESGAASSETTGEVAAVVNGVPITTDELDQWIKDDLFSKSARSPSKLFEMRQAGLEDLIADRIVQSEASRRGLSEEELLRLEVEALGPVSDADVEAFYAENKQQLGGAALENVSDRIRDFLQDRQQGEARTALRKKAEVVVHLEAPRAEIAATGPAKGPENARVTIIEFSDFQCPFCRRVLPTLDRVLEKYPNDVRVVYRNMPLRNHSRARPAAEAALCADEQGKFWAYHDLLFENSRQLGDEDLSRYAQEAGLDGEAFTQCFEENRFASQVNADVDEGREAGVSGTPAFFVNGILLSGAKPAEDFYRVIEAELERLGTDQV